MHDPNDENIRSCAIAIRALHWLRDCPHPAFRADPTFVARRIVVGQDASWTAVQRLLQELLHSLSERPTGMGGPIRGSDGHSASTPSHGEET